REEKSDKLKLRVAKSATSLSDENLKDCDRKGANRLFAMNDMPLANDTNDSNHKIKLDKVKFSSVGPYDDPPTPFFISLSCRHLIEYFVSMEHFAESDF
ncbi:hypothetical protein Bhyg_08235, partial [Pseudolycoriella hygida]